MVLVLIEESGAWVWRSIHRLLRWEPLKDEVGVAGILAYCACGKVAKDRNRSYRMMDLSDMLAYAEYLLDWHRLGAGDYINWPTYPSTRPPAERAG